MTIVAEWYQQYLQLDLKTIPSWRIIDELRLVANAVKHAEGLATRQLRGLRPELFRNPVYTEIYEENPEYSIRQTMSRVYAPLSGEDLFVTEELLRAYTEGAESFFFEIAEHFRLHADTPY